MLSPRLHGGHAASKNHISQLYLILESLLRNTMSDPNRRVSVG